MLNRGLGKTLFSRIGAYAVFVLGFWLLFQAFERSSPGLGVLGGALVLLAMYMMVGFRRYGFGSARDTDATAPTEIEAVEIGAAEQAAAPAEEDGQAHQ
jgi:hypothetical protein